MNLENAVSGIPINIINEQGKFYKQTNFDKVICSKSSKKNNILENFAGNRLGVTSTEDIQKGDLISSLNSKNETLKSKATALADIYTDQLTSESTTTHPYGQNVGTTTYTNIAIDQNPTCYASVDSDWTAYTLEYDTNSVKNNCISLKNPTARAAALSSQQFAIKDQTTSDGAGGTCWTRIPSLETAATGNNYPYNYATYPNNSIKTGNTLVLTNRGKLLFFDKSNISWTTNDGGNLSEIDVGNKLAWGIGTVGGEDISGWEASCINPVTDLPFLLGNACQNLAETSSSAEKCLFSDGNGTNNPISIKHCGFRMRLTNDGSIRVETRDSYKLEYEDSSDSIAWGAQTIFESPAPPPANGNELVVSSNLTKKLTLKSGDKGTDAENAVLSETDVLMSQNGKYLLQIVDGKLKLYKSMKLCLGSGDAMTGILLAADSASGQTAVEGRVVYGVSSNGEKKIGYIPPTVSTDTTATTDTTDTTSTETLPKLYPYPSTWIDTAGNLTTQDTGCPTKSDPITEYEFLNNYIDQDKLVSKDELKNLCNANIANEKSVYSSALDGLKSSIDNIGNQLTAFNIENTALKSERGSEESYLNTLAQNINTLPEYTNPDFQEKQRTFSGQLDSSQLDIDSKNYQYLTWSIVALTITLGCLQFSR